MASAISAQVKRKVVEFTFSPHHDNVSLRRGLNESIGICTSALAFGGSFCSSLRRHQLLGVGCHDGAVQLWSIPETGIFEALSDPDVSHSIE